ncbi:hypothetical protein [Streptomyces albidus (ex Kaewkla and Franco 2022)]|uniref:hypothetical protein n=1 Tax=Streptomyces albidus (ex Kaewkla and Franco 2022) TaxID=722709 RepID=UPI0015EFCFCE|nr:hypothetical protein [Streptomyces albidus (ex Kaewkla and Franco 2022)]
MLLQLLIICAWVVYLVGFVLLLAVLDNFRSRRTLLRLVLCTLSLIASGVMLRVAGNAEVPDTYADTALTRALDSAAHWLSYVLVVTGVAVFVTAGVRRLPAFRSR